MKRRASEIVLANLTPRPASKDFILSGKAVIKKLDGVATGHPPHLTTQADPAALVCADDGPTVDEIVKYCSSTRKPLGVVGYGESTVVQPLVNFGTCHKLFALNWKSISEAQSLYPDGWGFYLNVRNGSLATVALISHPSPSPRGGLVVNIIASCSRQPWNKGKLVGQKTPLRLSDIWAIRVRLQISERTRDLALFDLAIDSKLRACDLTKLRVRDVAHGEHISSRAMVMQQKTQRPVQFEITEQTRSALAAWIHRAQLHSEDCLFPSRLHTSDHLSTRQYARIVKGCVKAAVLDSAMYGTHTMRRTKASLIYRRTKNLRAVQLLLGHTKLESTVRSLGIEVDDALEMAEQTEV